MGIFFAYVALASWGLGDFLIQRSVRKFGNAIALFYITAFAAVVLLPFVFHDLTALFRQNDLSSLLVLVLATAVMLFAALFDFEALRIGKISVIEPIYALEVIITSVCAAVLLREGLAPLQILFICVLTVGLILVSLNSLGRLKKITWERGVAYAILATMAMGIVNFLFGAGSRETSPLLVNWFTSCGAAVIMLAYLAKTRQLWELKTSFQKNKRLVFGVSFVDNLAWVAFSYSTLYIPIAIATGISESYIVFAAILGIAFNRETLRLHQVIGLLLTVGAAITLSFTA